MKSLPLNLKPTPGEETLQQRFQLLLDDRESECELDWVSTQVAELWRLLAAYKGNTPLLHDVKQILSRCDQVAELVNRAVDLKSLEGHCEQLQSLIQRVKIADHKLQRLAKPLEALRAIYAQALEGTPLTVKARLYIPGKGHLLISQVVARKLGSVTEQGEKIKGESSGSNCVAHLHHVFYKSNPLGETGFSPALEAAVVSFHELLEGESAAPTACLKLRDVHTQKPDVREYVVQAGLGVYGAPLDRVLSVQQWVEIFQKHYGNDAFEILFDDQLIERVREGYRAIFREDGIDTKKLLATIYGEDALHPPEERLSDFKDIDISKLHEQHQFARFLASSEAMAGVWALAVVMHYPKVTQGLQLGNLFDWYKGMCWLKALMPEDSIPARIDFAKNWQTYLDKDKSALGVMSTLITLPKDGRADNYILALPCDAHFKPLPFPQGHIPPLHIVSIDNDISLQPPYIRGIEGLHLQFKSVLLHLKQMMEFTLSEKVKDQLLSRSAEDWILEWLKYPSHKEREFHLWQQEKLLTEEDLLSCGAAGVKHPCGIDPRVTDLMYSALKKLLEAVKTENISLSQIFQAVYPEIFAHYQALEQSDPLTSYHLVKTISLDEGEVPAFKVKQHPVVQSVAVLAKQFPWDKEEETVLRWLDLMGRMGFQEKCLTQEQAQKLLPSAIRRNLPGAIAVLCAHEVEGIIDTSTQQTVFHLFAHTYFDDRLTDQEALSIWKKLLSLPGSNVNARDDREKPPSFTLLDGMVRNPDRGAALIYAGIKQGLDLKISYNEETLFMRALRMAEEDASFREVVHRLIPLGAAQFTSSFHLKSYLHKTDDHISQELLLQHEPSLAWHFTLDTLAPPLTANSPRGTYPLTTTTESRSLTPNLTKTLQMMLTGKEASPETYGRHLVFPYQEGTHTVHIKVFPEAPGYEYAVKELFSVLFEEELPEHSLWRVETPQGITPLLCSQTVAGDNLHTLYKQDPLEAHHRLSQLDEDHFANLLCGTILSLPEDGKPDNFILNGRRLVGIDNDHAFIRAITYKEKDGVLIPILNLKSIVLCLDQMQQPLSERVINKIQKWPIGDLLRLWLERLDRQHQAFEKQFAKDKTLRQKWVDNKQTAIGILFDSRTFPQLYDRIQKMHQIFSREPKLTGFDLLQRMLPTVYPFYQAVFNQFHHPVDRFYKGIAPGRYGQSPDGKVTTLTASLSLLSTQGLLEKSWYNPSSSQTPAFALQQMRAMQQEHREIFGVQTLVQKGKVEAILELISPRNREKVINQLDFTQIEPKKQKELFKILTDSKTEMSFRKLRIKGSILSDAELLGILKLSPDLEELVLSNCPHLTNASIGQLGQLAPQVRTVHLHRLPNIREIGLKVGFFSPKVETLLLSRCSYFHVEECLQLVNLRIRTPVLESLIIKECPQLDYTHITSNLTRVPKLIVLDLPLPEKYQQPLLFALNKQKRHQATVQVLEKAFPGPQNELSLPGLNMTECMEEMIPLLQKVQPKILNLPSTHLTPEGVAALIRASLYPGWIAFDKRQEVVEDHIGIFGGHEGPVYTCCQLSDGRILSSSGDKTLKVWDLITFQCLATLKGHKGSVFTCYQCSDGGILSGCEDKTLKVWDPITFQCLATLKGHEGHVYTCYQLSDERILSGSGDKTLKVWNPITLQCLATLKGHEDCVNTCYQLSDGKILSGSFDKTLKVWDPITFQCLATLKGHKGKVLTCYQLSDGKILSGSADKTLKVWDPTTFKCLATLTGHDREVVTTCYQLSDGKILSGSFDKTLKVWDPITFQCLVTLKKHEKGVQTCYQLFDGRVLSCSNDKTLKVWDMAVASPIQWEKLKQIREAVSWVEGDGYLSLLWRNGSERIETFWKELLERFGLGEKEIYQEVTSQGKLVITQGGSERLRVLLEALQAPHGLPIDSLKVPLMSEKGATILLEAAAHTKHLELPLQLSKTLTHAFPKKLATLTLPIATVGEIKEVGTHNCYSVPSSCSQLSDGRIISGSADTTLKVWDPISFQCLATLKEHQQPVVTCFQLFDGRILSGSWDATFKVWDPITFQCLATFTGHVNGVNNCCQLSDGRILSGSWDTTLKILDPITFQRLATLEGHDEAVWTCCQLSDGRILSGSGDKTLKVWDPITFQCLATLTGHENRISICCQLSDGKILSGSLDCTLKVWDPITFQCLATLEGHESIVMTCFQFSDGRILSGSGDGTLKVWDPITFQCLATLKEHEGPIWTCCQLSDGKILSGSGDNTFKIWKVPYEKRTLQVDQLSALADQVVWRRGKIVGPLGADMGVWLEQMRQFITIMLPGVRIIPEGNNEFAIESPGVNERVYAMITPFVSLT